MLARVGDVLYWAATGISWLIIAGTGAFFLMAERLPSIQEQLVGIVAALVCALIVWLVGRAARYVLAGR